jgi:hypothetical protein
LKSVINVAIATSGSTVGASAALKEIFKGWKGIFSSDTVRNAPGPMGRTGRTAVRLCRDLGLQRIPEAELEETQRFVLIGLPFA